MKKFDGLPIQNNVVNFLSFSDLIDNLKFIEKTRTETHIRLLLGLTKEQLLRFQRSEKLHKSLNSQVLYGRFLKYCNFRDLDANDFFTRKLREELIDA